MSIDALKQIILEIVNDYAIGRVTLFFFFLSGTNRDDSDIDLIVEFNKPVTLLTLSDLKDKLESLTGLDVDVIHGPIRDTDMIEVGEAVELYAA